MNATNQMIRRLAHGRLGNEVYRLRRLASWPVIARADAADRDLVETLRREAIASTPLERLVEHPDLSFVPALDRALDAQHRLDRADPTDGRSTSLHSTNLSNRSLVEQFPEFVRWGVHPRLFSVVEAYLGVRTAWTDLVVRRDFGSGAQVGTRIWHLDTEDVRVVRVIVYLTDVTMENGPFEYLDRATTRSLTSIHRRAKRAQGDPVMDAELEGLVPRERWCQATGTAGTAVIADNAALLHHGRPHDSVRLAAFFTYTSRLPVYPELSDDGWKPAGLDERARSRFHLPG